LIFFIEQIYKKKNLDMKIFMQIFVIILLSKRKNSHRFGDWRYLFAVMPRHIFYQETGCPVFKAVGRVLGVVCQ